MIKLKHTLLAVLLPLMAGCADNNIGFDPVENVPAGVYVSGSSTEFSRPIATGQLVAKAHENILSHNVWLTTSGGLRISYVGDDGHPVYYGGQITSTDAASGVMECQLGEGNGEITVPAEGLYTLVVSKQKKKLTIIPVKLYVRGELALNDKGDRTLPLAKMEYDRLRHVVTWSNADSTEFVLPTEYAFAYADGKPVVVTDDNEAEADTFATVLTGTGKSVRTNVLNAKYAPLTAKSDVNLRFTLKGQYAINVQYSVLDNAFTARVGGDGVEATGLSEHLYMAGDGVGSWNSPQMVTMTPVGAAGNGEFWGLGYVKAGKTLAWSTSPDGANTVKTFNTVVGTKLDDNGQAAVEQTGLYLVYVDLNRKLLAFEKPEVYGTGECFGGEEIKADVAGNKLSLNTSNTGALKLYATSKYNARDWNTMLLTIENGKLVYPGLNTANVPTVPVAKQTTVNLNVAEGSADFGEPTPESKISGSVDQLYLTGDAFGQWNWASPGVVSLENGYAGKSRWFYIAYLKAGTGVKFSEEKAFGNGNFATLATSTGFTVQNNRAVVAADGIYMIYVGLDSREVAIEPVKLQAWSGSSSATFTVDADGKSMSVTLPETGRVRMYPSIPTFKHVNKFGDWKREVYVDPETGEFLFRKQGAPEPNKDYVWTAGTKITINFETMKATIVKP